MSSTEIILCDASDAKRWNNFLANTEESSFYQLYAWQEINQSHFGHRTYSLAALEDGNLTGVFPLVYLNSRLFGRILCSMPFVNFGGICAKNNETEQLLLNEAISLAKQLDVDYLENRACKIVDPSLPTAKHKVSMTIELDNNPDNIWNAFASKHRTNIRRAYKNSLTVRSGGDEYLDIFYKVLASSWRTLGTPIYQRAYFKTILEKFGSQIRIFICYHKDTPIAAAFNGYYKNTVEGMWAGSLPEARRLQYSYVLYWEMIKHACENGYEQYHLGRSSVDSGGEQFKKKWNATQLQLYWQYFLNKNNELPQLNVDNPKYKLAINSWRKMPIQLTTLLGPFLSKYIP
jgi:FemAB-related protein (PEP-CTERM system-associated)